MSTRRDAKVTARSELRAALIEEFKFLRATPGTLHVFKLNECPNICMCVGFTETFKAVGPVRDWMTAFMDDLKASKLNNTAVASLVILADEENALRKREAVAAQIFKDERTVRRMSDKGIADLADIFMASADLHGWLDHLT